MLLKIVEAGSEYLSDISKPVTPSQLKQSKTQQLIDLMIETLRDKPGVGLAAPQVGEPLRIIIIEDKKKYLEKVPQELLMAQGRKPVPLKVIVNPEVRVIDEAEQFFFEGCLSVGGYRAIVPRASKVVVSGLDRHGKKISITAEGWLARIIQHEVDHLNGHLYIEKMYPQSFLTEQYFSKRWAEATLEKINKFVERIQSTEF
jgi:peptide deformylase